jgi:hypothetical protein
VVLQSVERRGVGEVDHDVLTARADQGEGLDDTVGVTRLANGVAGVETQRSLPAVHGLIVLVCGGGA